MQMRRLDGLLTVVLTDVKMTPAFAKPIARMPLTGGMPNPLQLATLIYRPPTPFLPFHLPP